jgi:hypothetical protein
MHSGKLWTPEGYGFDPHDSNWRGLPVRKAGPARTEVLASATMPDVPVANTHIVQSQNQLDI